MTLRDKSRPEHSQKGYNKILINITLMKSNRLHNMRNRLCTPFRDKCMLHKKVFGPRLFHKLKGRSESPLRPLG